MDRGKQSRLLTTVGKDGMLRTADRDSREVVYSTPVTMIKNADVPVTKEGVLACPGVLGGVEWDGPPLDRGRNTLFVNAVDWCWTFASDEIVRHIPGRNYMGGSLQPGSMPQGWLTAVDASTGAVKWKHPSKRLMISAVTATKGNVVFHG